MDNGMDELIAEHGPAYNINIRMFNVLATYHYRLAWWQSQGQTILTVPKERSLQKNESVIFSPHPDDDVISMGGTFIRLVDQGHDVHVAYQTSGNIAVFDEDVVRFADFLQGFQRGIQRW